MSKVLVTGGGGYVGSHATKQLLRAGHSVVVVDNFSTGSRHALYGVQTAECDISDTAALRRLFHEHSIDAVMHFASLINVSESAQNPHAYYRNNVAATLSLLQAMLIANVPRFIFSSSAAIYGRPLRTPIDEEHPKSPINVYGRTKWMVEQILEDFGAAYGLRYVALRYFNAAGADPNGELGERHDPETHLIPVVLQAASGRRHAVTVFGTNYETSDGTCIRDYVHVTDLAEAHMLALEYLVDGGASTAFNLGNGEGFSVLEVISKAKQVTGTDFDLTYAARREGDPAILVADSTRARRILRWRPQFDSLEKIIEHAWRWEQKLASG